MACKDVADVRLGLLCAPHPHILLRIIQTLGVDGGFDVKTGGFGGTSCEQLKV